MKVIYAKTGEAIKVSDRDFRLLSQFSWHLDRQGYPYTRCMMTKIILPFAGTGVRDHKNDDKLDARRRNLEIITHAQNIQKARPSKSSKKSSKFRGVCWHRDAKKWRSVLSYREGSKKIQVHLGVFASEKSAARAYDKAAKARWGRFAWQNL